MGGFNIKRGPLEIQIPEDSFESYMSQQECMQYTAVSAEHQEDVAASTLYILPSAFMEINKHIGWKKCTSTNTREQGGILVGNVYRDRESQLICGVVQHVIPSAKAGNATYIQFSHEDWALMYKEFEKRFSALSRGAQPLRIIGWYHTHPNMPVRMSAIDKQTHAGFFGGDHQFSVIFNPQRGIWAVFNGKECRNCNGTLFCVPNKSENRDRACSDDRMMEEHPMVSTQNNSFVIKRRSSFYESSEEWKGRTVIDGICYYYPLNINQIKTETVYVISERLIENFAFCIDNWEFLNKESVCAIYYINKESLRAFHAGSIEYILFEKDIPLDADGITFNDGRGGFLKYLGMPDKNDVRLVVIYSAKRPSLEYLCEGDEEYECILWINPKISNEFGFYMSNFNPGLRKGKFNIKGSNRLNIEQIDSIEMYKCMSDLFAKMIRAPFGWNDRGYCVAEFDDSKCNGRFLLIVKRVLEVLFQKIEGYNKIGREFSMLISFMSANHLNEGHTVADPFGNRFILVQIFSKNDMGITRSASLKYSNHTVSGTSRADKLAVIITNRNINIGEYQNKLADHLGAVCLNIETEEYRFYCLS